MLSVHCEGMVLAGDAETIAPKLAELVNGPTGWRYFSEGSGAIYSNGDVSLVEIRPGRFHVSMFPVYTSDPNDPHLVPYPLGEALRFDITRLGRERSELAAYASGPALHTFVDEILTAICAR